MYNCTQGECGQVFIYVVLDRKEIMIMNSSYEKEIKILRQNSNMLFFHLHLYVIHKK